MVSVSYTHLDVYKRQEWRIEKREHTNIAKKLNTIKNVTCITSAATVLDDKNSLTGAICAAKSSMTVGMMPTPTM